MAEAIPVRGFLGHMTHYDPRWWEGKPTEEPVDLDLGIDPQWQPIFTAIALSPTFCQDGTALIGTLEDGIFRSTDQGRSWSAANFGLLPLGILALVTSPAMPIDRLAYAATENGLYTSPNEGRAWKDMPSATAEDTYRPSVSSPHQASARMGSCVWERRGPVCGTPLTRGSTGKHCQHWQTELSMPCVSLRHRDQAGICMPGPPKARSSVRWIRAEPGSAQLTLFPRSCH